MVGPRTIATWTPPLLNIFPSTTSLPIGGPAASACGSGSRANSANDLLTGALSWFEFIDFRRDIGVGSLFGGHQFLGEAAPKITLRRFHQPRHQVFRHSVGPSILRDFADDSQIEANRRSALGAMTNLPHIYRWKRLTPMTL